MAMSFLNGTLTIEVSNRNKLYLLKREFQTDEEILKLTKNRLQSVHEFYFALKNAINSTHNKTPTASLYFNEVKEELLLKYNIFIMELTLEFSFQREEIDVSKTLKYIWKKVDDSR